MTPSEVMPKGVLQEQKRQSILWCQKYPTKKHPDGFIYQHVTFSPEIVLLYNKDIEPIRIIVEECEEFPDCYWAWWEIERKPFGFHFVYCQKFLVSMCFAYGPKVEEERGRGFLLPVKITESPLEN